MKRWMTFFALSAATALIYYHGWLLALSAVVMATDAVGSLRELCIGVVAFGVAWLVRRFIKHRPLTLCCLAGALPVLAVWLHARSQPVWEVMTPYLRWRLLTLVLMAALALPLAFLALRDWRCVMSRLMPRSQRRELD